MLVNFILQVFIQSDKFRFISIKRLFTLNLEIFVFICQISALIIDLLYGA